MDYQPYIDAGIGVDSDIVVSERLGRTRERVRQVRNKLGMPKPNLPHRECLKRVIRRAAMQEMAEHGMTVMQIADALGAAAETVHRYATVTANGRCRYDWSTVDWTRGNIEIATRLGASLSTVGTKRMELRRAGLPIPRAPYWIARHPESP